MLSPREVPYANLEIAAPDTGAMFLAYPLVNTSVSMGFGIPGTDRSRIEALVASARADLGTFPDDAALGLWAFGGAAGRNVNPYAGLAALERLDAVGADGTHRDALLSSTQSGHPRGGLPGDQRQQPRRQDARLDRRGVRGGGGAPGA
ncbi:hypothetical protein [Dietzia sp. ANT_WB102]|uniref:hypothetical protein n=1 Tax=Dietzia sp. ANT_WB102 TaxID=2597345 RepID=UPI0011EFC99D|nr:hypothetical protein [Dietzia sp. ANT_WB102]KAA0916933.1 hypothetical protein FQ137_11825 [Dietzia sp. ANT_WB102]